MGSLLTANKTLLVWSIPQLIPNLIRLFVKNVEIFLKKWIQTQVAWRILLFKVLFWSHKSLPGHAAVLGNMILRHGSLDAVLLTPADNMDQFSCLMSYGAPAGWIISFQVYNYDFSKEISMGFHAFWTISRTRATKRHPRVDTAVWTFSIVGLSGVLQQTINAP